MLALGKRFGLPVNPTDVVDDLSVGLQQRVEILKALHRGADILVLDEPTAVLSPAECDELFEVLRGIVKEKGMTVILITHKLHEVMAVFRPRRRDEAGQARGHRKHGGHR